MICSPASSSSPSKPCRNLALAFQPSLHSLERGGDGVWIGPPGYIRYLPTIRSVNDPGTGGPSCIRPGTGGGALAGTGPYSNALVIT